MTKIAFISANDHAPHGGSEVLWFHTALLLRQRSYKVAVSLARWNPLPLHVQELHSAGVEVYYHTNDASWKQRLFAKVVHLVSSGATLYWPKDYSTIISQFRPNLVFISQGSMLQGLQAMAFCKALGVPYISSTRLVSELQWIDDHSAALLLDLLSHSLLNFFPSKANIISAELILGSPIPNAVAVPSPCRIPSLDLIKHPHPISNGIELACVAALNIAHKGQDKLLKLFSMPKWRDRNVNLHFYGDGPNQKILFRLADRLRLANVYFHGHVDDIYDIWNNCHGLIMASNMEGLPIALLEAMLFQKVSIVPNVGGTGDLIVDNINGFLADSSSTASLDLALDRAWQRRDDWQVIGERAFESVVNYLPQSPEEVVVEHIVQLIG